MWCFKVYNAPHFCLVATQLGLFVVAWVANFQKALQATMLYEYQLLSSPLADFVDFKYFERPNKNSKKYFDSTFSFSPVITWKH